MNKSELRKEIRKTKTRTLQTARRFTLMLICVEIIIWSVKGMSTPILVAILSTCTADVVVGVILLKEL